MVTRFVPRFRALAAVAVTGLLSGCATIGYYYQAASGHSELMRARVPVGEVIERPGTDDVLRERLLLVQEIRDFASRELGLPENDSYRYYAELDRDFILWNVTAAPEFSLRPRHWCYLIVGCQSYRGYFNRDRAERFAADLENRGYDVVVRGVTAYSTLGRFNDPVTSGMLRRSDHDLAEVIFHELAHQQLYIRDDTAFNEGYATFVGEQGLREWLQARGDDEGLARREAYRARVAAFHDLLRGPREQLRELYASDLPEDVMRERKAEILGGIREAFEQKLVVDDPEMTRWRAWFDGPVNNARLAGLATYRNWVPAFATLFDEHDGDWEAFHDAVEQLGRMPAEERTRELEERLPSY